MSSHSEPSLGRRQFPIFWFILGFSIFNFLAPPVMDSAGPSDGILPVIGCLVGVIAGQCGLLAVWGVLGPLRAAVRLTLNLAVALILLGAFGLGVVVVDTPPDDSLGEILSVGLFVPMVLLAIQLPLWIFRLITGGRIVHAGLHADRSASPPQQFGLRDVMGGTVVVAVALSLANSGMAVLDVRGPEGWIPLLVTCVTFGIISAFATLPCVWAAMIAKNKEAAAGIIAIYALVIFVILLIVLGILSQGMMPGEVIVVVFFMFAATMAIVLGTLHVARVCGYVFISRRKPQAAVEGSSPFAVEDGAVNSAGNEEADIPSDAGEDPFGPDRPTE